MNRLDSVLSVLGLLAVGTFLYGWWPTPIVVLLVVFGAYYVGTHTRTVHWQPETEDEMRERGEIP